MKKRPVRELLVVDDDEMSRRLAYDVLMHAGYRVSACDTGEQALVLAQTNRFDLVLLDIQLPGISGVQTFAQLRRLPGWAQVPVIALTASVMPNERNILMTEGFDAFLAKPLSIKELVRLVRQTLDSPP